MVFPKRWGEGTPFVFSGLEGEARYTGQMIGTLLQNRRGICFTCRSDNWTLYADVEKLAWDLVVCDQLTGHLAEPGMQTDEPDHSQDSDRVCSFGFYDAHTVIGRVPHGTLRCCKAGTETAFTAETMAAFTDTDGSWKDGDLAIEIRTVDDMDYFRMTYDKVAGDSTGQPLPEQVRELEVRHKAFYEGLACPSFKNPEMEETFYKACSVMKAGFYSPEEPFRQRWTTPDKTPHQTMFLWDSVFHSFGNRVFGTDIAKETILSVLDTEYPDGFIPHMSAPDHHSEVTQPPLLAWGVWELYKRL